MQLSLSIRLLKEQIKSNKYLYRPVLIVGPFMIALIYVVFSMADMIKQGGSFAGARSMGTMFDTLSYVFAIISLFIFFYLNSFLAQRRQKTFGLYAVLGLNKKNLLALTGLELLFLAVFMIAIGLVLGLGLSYLAYDVFSRVIDYSYVRFSFLISRDALVKTALLYLLIFFLLFIFSAIKLAKSRITELLSSEEQGEKEPRTRWIITIVSFALLVLAYYLANQNMPPDEAILIFPTAVILVIVATYGIFIGGLVLILKALKKNKRIYYKPANFINLSNLIFRMKANGAGLATISILFTCAILTFSVTSSLFFGVSKYLNVNNDKDISAIYYFDYQPRSEDESARQIIDEAWGQDFVAKIDKVATDMGEQVSQGEYHVEYETRNFARRELSEETQVKPDGMSMRLRYSFNIASEDKAKFVDYFTDITRDLGEDNPFGKHSDLTELGIHQQYYGIEDNQANYRLMMSSLGTLFFIGIYFIFFFLLASGLVLYFRQLGEAYADRPRYLILQELGLSHRQVKKTIRTQVLLMFFMPLVFSILNVFASYRILWSFLGAISSNALNAEYFGTMSFISVAIFTIIYFILYLISSRTYYRIVERRSVSA